MSESIKIKPGEVLKEKPLQFPENLDRVQKYFHSSKQGSNSLIASLSKESNDTLSFEELSSVLENEDALESFILYLDAMYMETPGHFLYYFSLLKQAMQKNKKIEQAIARLEDNNKASFNALKLKEETVRSYLMPDPTFFKLLEAHKEWLKTIRN